MARRQSRELVTAITAVLMMILTDLVTALALGGDCLADIGVLRAPPAPAGPVASHPVVSRLITALAADAPRVAGDPQGRPLRQSSRQARASEDAARAPWSIPAAGPGTDVDRAGDEASAPRCAQPTRSRQ